MMATATDVFAILLASQSWCGLRNALMLFEQVRYRDGQVVSSKGEKYILEKVSLSQPCALHDQR
jgi:hypothetical protein